MLDSHGQVSPLETLQPVTDAATVSAMVRAVRSVFTSDAIKQYVVDLSAATRSSSALRLGASPARDACTCCAPPVRTPRSRVATTCCPTTSSRSCCRSWRTASSPRGETQLARRSTGEVLQDLMRRVPVPASGR